MKYQEITTLTVEEIKEKISAEKAALKKLKFAHSISAIENPMQISNIRKNIARLSTELTAKNKA